MHRIGSAETRGKSKWHSCGEIIYWFKASVAPCWGSRHWHPHKIHSQYPWKLFLNSLYSAPSWKGGTALAPQHILSTGISPSLADKQYHNLKISSKRSKSTGQGAESQPAAEPALLAELAPASVFLLLLQTPRKMCTFWQHSLRWYVKETHVLIIQCP